MSQSAAVASAHKHHFVTLDGMRGVLAVCVVLLHFGLNDYLLNAFHWRGFDFRICVDVFFLLSGYVLTYAGRKGVDPALFLVKRVFRLLPVYYVTTLVMLIWVGSHIPVIDWAVVSPFFGANPVNGPGWSICAEFYFPILAVMTVLLPLRLPDPVVKPALILVLLALGWADLPLAVDDHHHLPRAVLGLLGGHLLYRSGLDYRLPFLPVFCAMVLLMAAAMYVRWAALPVPGVACLAIMSGRHDQGIVSTAPFRVLGNLSYTLYLAHWPVLIFFRQHWAGVFEHSFALNLAALGLSAIFALALTRLVERPGMQLGAVLIRQLAVYRTRAQTPS